jgi:predicted nuclease of predicted toxin-antitoxin system
LRFLVDENLPGAVAELLRADGHDVLAVAPSAFRSADDTELWALAARERRVVVTRDLGFPHPLSHGVDV